ncbi:MAG: HAMP domain-containing protein [Gammaproteobacteria bacterium]|nr:MAG: HAMP domain-containing protein [Gammaproteobacteria bacterium]
MASVFGRIKKGIISLFFENRMYSSILFRKMVLSIQIIVILFSIVILYFSLLLIRSTVNQLEENSSETILDNVYQMVNSEYQASKIFGRLKIESQKKHLKNITLMLENHIKKKYRANIVAGMSEGLAQEIVLEDVASFLYGSNRFWVISSDNKILAHTDEKYIGMDSGEVKGKFGMRIFNMMTKATKEKGDGYFDFPEEDKSGEERQRYYYCRYLQELDWVIGVDVDRSDINAEIKKRDQKTEERLRGVVEKIHVSHYGYIFIFDADFNIKAHPEYMKVVGKFDSAVNGITQKALAKELVEAAEKKEPMLEFIWNFAGDEEGDRRQIARIRYSEDMLWYIVITMDKEELASSSDRLTYIIVSMVVVMLFFLNIFGMIFLKKILDPIKELSDIAIKAKNGNLDLRCDIKSNDEVGILAAAFNSMIEQIKDNIDNLDRKVSERTAELDEKNLSLLAEIKERENAEYKIQKMNEDLETRVRERTGELRESLDALQKAQDQLVQAEKMASLGGLVAGVAHEINTPVGIGVTEASYLKEKTEVLLQSIKEGKLKKSDLDKYMEGAIGASKSILLNLNRAADLISSFKQVASDQTSSEAREFNVREYIDETLVSLHSKIKKTGHKIEVSCPEKLTIISHPGAFSQILTNFIMNSLIHGFEFIDEGNITIEVMIRDQQFVLCYRDDGKGMPPEKLKNIFEPFYTTKRGQGGTGLGMHIVYNIVHQTLGGVIDVTLPNDGGIAFYIKIPAEGVVVNE